MTRVPGDVGVDGRNNRCEPLAAGLGDLSLLHVLPVTPVLKPSLVILAHIKVDIETPAHGLNPLKLERVQLRDGDATHLRPGAVLEGVVIEELASQKQRDGQVTPDLSLGSLVRTLSLQGVDPLGKVVHSKEDGGAGQSCRGEDLRHELAEGRSHSSLRCDDTGGHLGNVLGHHVDLIVEDGTHASGHDEGFEIEPTKIERDLCRKMKRNVGP
ncbi:hypothetical protein HG531_013936 [Fusarium graminearum]|nr:hypothetical protein HG531_013936 [Fusarium graminearum]